jgi:hypothetical protein
LIRKKRPFIRQQSLYLGIWPNQVPTMGKDNNRAPYFKVHIPYIPEDEKEADPSDSKPPSVKLLPDAAGKAIDNPTLHVQPIFNGGATEYFFKWFKGISSLLEGLQSLLGTDKALWQR